MMLAWLLLLPQTSNAYHHVRIVYRGGTGTQNLKPSQRISLKFQCCSHLLHMTICPKEVTVKKKIDIAFASMKSEKVLGSHSAFYGSVDKICEI